MLQYHGCGGDFVVRLYLIPLTSGQSCEKFHQIFFTLKPNTASHIAVAEPMDGWNLEHGTLGRLINLNLHMTLAAYYTIGY